MKQDLFTRINGTIIAGLAVLLVVLIANGAFGLYWLQQSQQTNRFYTDAAMQACEIQLLFLQQIQMWKNILLSREHIDDYRSYHYTFSKLTSQIQDALYNLAITLYEDRLLSRSITAARHVHRLLSERYMLLTVEMEKLGIRYQGDPALIMENQEKQAIVSMESIVIAIKKLSEATIEKKNNFFIFMVTGSMVFLTMLSVALMVRIISTNRKSQRAIISIGRRLNSYLPPQLVASILDRDASAGALIMRKPISVCFTDLQGFTALTESTDPEIIARILDDYLADMTFIAHAWGGLVDKFIGDGIMILFGAMGDPDSREQTIQCIHMAMAMQAHMETLRRRWHAQGIMAPINLRIGINSGFATIGTFGPDDRRAFTAIGSVVNIASRIEKICPANGVLISESTRELLDGVIECKTFETRQLKGIIKPVPLYQIVYASENDAKQTVLQDPYLIHRSEGAV